MLLFTSGVGAPAETYYHNVEWVTGTASLIYLPAAVMIFVPYFYNLKITSVYQVSIFI